MSGELEGCCGPSQSAAAPLVSPGGFARLGCCLTLDSMARGDWELGDQWGIGAADIIVIGPRPPLWLPWPGGDLNRGLPDPSPALELLPHTACPRGSRPALFLLRSSCCMCGSGGGFKNCCCRCRRPGDGFPFRTHARDHHFWLLCGMFLKRNGVRQTPPFRRERRTLRGACSCRAVVLQTRPLATMTGRCTTWGSSGRRSTWAPSAPVLATEGSRWVCGAGGGEDFVRSQRWSHFENVRLKGD